jgi:hypothetical protein
MTDGGIMICGCGFSSDPPCDQYTLWYMGVTLSVSHAVGGYCMGYRPSPDGGFDIGGYIVLDSEGRVVENTAFGAAEVQRKQSWLDYMSGYRWPCLAGETIPFTCDRSGE